MTTIETLTTEQIEQLQTEAGAAGNTLTASDCALALDANNRGHLTSEEQAAEKAALGRIVAVIRNAEAQASADCFGGGARF